MQQPPSPEICNTGEQPPRPNKKLFNKGCANLSGVSLAATSSKGSFSINSNSLLV